MNEDARTEELNKLEEQIKFHKSKVLEYELKKDELIKVTHYDIELTKFLYEELKSIILNDPPEWKDFEPKNVFILAVSKFRQCIEKNIIPEKKGFKLDIDEDWLRKKADQEDGCILSVGGLINKMNEIESKEFNNDTKEFIEKLQEAEDKTRNHTIHFGPKKSEDSVKDAEMKKLVSKCIDIYYDNCYKEVDYASLSKVVYKAYNEGRVIKLITVDEIIDICKKHNFNIDNAIIGVIVSLMIGELMKQGFKFIDKKEDNNG